MNEEQKQQEIPDKSFIMAKATDIALRIVLISLVVIFAIIYVIKKLL